MATKLPIQVKALASSCLPSSCCESRDCSITIGCRKGKRQGSKLLVVSTDVTEVLDSRGPARGFTKSIAAHGGVFLTLPSHPGEDMLVRVGIFLEQHATDTDAEDGRHVQGSYCYQERSQRANSNSSHSEHSHGILNRLPILITPGETHRLGNLLSSMGPT